MRRVISRRYSVPLPAHSPDLNPLDYCFWGSIESKICKERRSNTTELKSMVEKAAFEISAETIINSVQNIIRRLQLCAQKNGSDFEAELKIHVGCV